jgi:Holliday junction resolvase RusA-like endonuclease
MRPKVDVMIELRMFKDDRQIKWIERLVAVRVISHGTKGVRKLAEKIVSKNA